MANLTKTVTNSLRFFGGSPSSKWGAFNWNEFLWGEGTADIPVRVTHMISESLVLDSAITTLDVRIILQNSLSIDSENESEYLTDGSGYNYVFPSNVINHENQSIPSYTVGSSPNNNWSSGSSSSTVWS